MPGRENMTCKVTIRVTKGESEKATPENKIRYPGQSWYSSNPCLSTEN